MEINLVFPSRFFTCSKSQNRNLSILITKRSLRTKWEMLFIIFKWLSLKKKNFFWESESHTLNLIIKPRFSFSLKTTFSVPGFTDFLQSRNCRIHVSNVFRINIKNSCTIPVVIAYQQTCVKILSRVSKTTIRSLWAQCADEFCFSRFWNNFLFLIKWNLRWYQTNAGKYLMRSFFCFYGGAFSWR